MIDGPRVAVIGLDCAAPDLLFNTYAKDLPNISSLLSTSLWGDLESIIPPITVPAWACAMTGLTPGQLGIYGFRNRKDRTYDGLSLATSQAVTREAVWDRLGRVGGKSLLIGVPPGYPPKPVPGWQVSCFLTPDSARSYTWPAALAGEIEEEVGEYIFDIPNFRLADEEFVLRRIHAMTERRFKVARRLVRNKPWDFFMMVEIALDRLHHVFWQHCDPTHVKYAGNNPFESAFHDYYRLLDREIGALLEVLPSDTVTIVMSDHGARRMDGGVCLNEWLMREGYLRMLQPLEGPTRIGDAPVDWSRTIAWGDGGYYGRIFLNLRGREPEGVVEPAEYEELRSEIADKLEAMLGTDGKRLGNRVFRPDAIYPEVEGLAPDLMVYFGDLSWRSVGMVGTGEIFTLENDTGPDGANHAQFGVFAMSGAPATPARRAEGLWLVDVGPTILDMYGVDAGDVVGRSFL
ncbi:MAG: alkaline phosphatase family protein [Actinomycetota bacterium]